MNGKRYWVITFIATLAFLAILVALPHQKYLRYQALEIGAYSKSKWIYERIHFDPANIDIAFLGTSHTLNGIDSGILSAKLSQLTGRTVVATNLAIPHYGRDMHLALGRELLSKRRPKVLVIEIRESEVRDSHPATHYLADRSELITAPLLVNMRYAGNLARLPYRQGHLFLKTMMPSVFGAQHRFDPKTYSGTHLNYTLRSRTGLPRSQATPQAELVTLRQAADVKGQFKLARTNPLKTFLYYNANFTNLRRLVAESRAADVQVLFLYLPNHGSASRPVDWLVYESMAPVVYPDLQSLYAANVWFDLGHLNADGAIKLSNEIAHKLHDML